MAMQVLRGDRCANCRSTAHRRSLQRREGGLGVSRGEERVWGRAVNVCEGLTGNRKNTL